MRGYIHAQNKKYIQSGVCLALSKNDKTQEKKHVQCIHLTKY